MTANPACTNVQEVEQSVQEHCIKYYDIIVVLGDEIEGSVTFYLGSSPSSLPI